jgi:hypothetical protein
LIWRGGGIDFWLECLDEYLFLAISQRPSSERGNVMKQSFLLFGCRFKVIGVILLAVCGYGMRVLFLMA